MALLSTFFDDFDDNSTDVTKWPSNFNGAGNTMAETGAAVVITLGGTSGQYSAYDSGVTTTYDMTSNGAYVKTSTVTPDAATNAQCFLKLYKDSTNYLTIGKTAGNLLCQRQVAGVDSNTTVTFNATTMLWWRLIETAGNILWQTSKDGRFWVTQRTLANPFVITAMSVQIGAGCFAAQATPGGFTADTFNTTAGNTGLPQNLLTLPPRQAVKRSNYF